MSATKTASRKLREAQDVSFPEDVAEHILLGIGIEPATAAKVVRTNLPDPSAAYKIGAT